MIRCPLGKVYACSVNPLPADDLEHILLHTAPLWEQARGQRIFLSGGTGFFGMWLLESLAFCNRRLNLGISVTVLSRDPTGFLQRASHLASEPAIQLVQGDIRDFPIPEGEFRYVVHAAAPTTAEASGQPRELLRTLIDGTDRMLRLAQSRGTKSFVFVSSGAVYGRQPASLSYIPENYLGGPDWLDPKTAYGEGKRVCEQMSSLCAQEGDIAMTIARCFAFAGPHLPLDQHFAIGNFIGDALAGRNIKVRGDGTPLRSYLYSADLVIWLWTMLFSARPRQADLQVFNVGSGEAISIADLAQVVAKELNPSLKVEIAEQPVEGRPVLRYVPDVRRAEAELGLKQTISLREAIRRTAAWHRLQMQRSNPRRSPASQS